MSNLAKTTLAIFAAAFLASSPVIAAETAAPAAGAATMQATPAKPDLAGGLKQKASDMIQQGQKKADDAAQKLQDALGVKKQAPAADQMKQDAAAKTKMEAGKAADQAKTEAGKAAAGAKEEIVDVQQETVTVQTPTGTAQETTTIITPEGQAKK